MLTDARHNFLHETNWIKPYFKAAFPPPSAYGGPNLGVNSPVFSMDVAGNYNISSGYTGDIRYPAVITPDRRVAAYALTHLHPMLTRPPPSMYEWGKNKTCDHIERDIGESDRAIDLYYDPCPANTTLGIGWKERWGFKKPPKRAIRAGCMPPLLQ